MSDKSSYNPMVLEITQSVVIYCEAVAKTIAVLLCMLRAMAVSTIRDFCGCAKTEVRNSLWKFQ